MVFLAPAQGREHARLAIGVDHARLLESGITRKLAMYSAPCG
jgi:hypothetical protein